MQVLTYIPEFNVVLSRRCVLACSHCNFPNTPSPILPSLRTIKRYVRTAERLGALQITLTAGEGISELPEIESAARYYGFEDYNSYLEGVCRTILQNRTREPVFPVLEVGRIAASRAKCVKEVVAAVRLILGSLEEYDKMGSCGRTAEQRLTTLADFGKFGVPMVTGIIVGVGEHPNSWREAARRVVQIQHKYGNIQRFVIKPFRPQPFSKLANRLPARDDTVLSAINIVRDELAGQVSLSAELQEKLHMTIAASECGIDDIGPIRLGSSEQINVDAVALLDEHRNHLKSRGIQLKVRLPFEASSTRPLPALVQESLDRHTRHSSNRTPVAGSSVDCA